jgi:hypothetical protein
MTNRFDDFASHREVIDGEEASDGGARRVVGSFTDAIVSIQSLARRAACGPVVSFLFGSGYLAIVRGAILPTVPHDWRRHARISDYL